MYVHICIQYQLVKRKPWIWRRGGSSIWDGLKGGKGRERWYNYLSLKAKIKSCVLGAVEWWVVLDETGKDAELTLQPAAFLRIFYFQARQPHLCIALITLYFLTSGRTLPTSWWKWGSKLYGTKALSTPKDTRPDKRAHICIPRVRKQHNKAHNTLICCVMIAW